MCFTSRGEDLPLDKRKEENLRVKVCIIQTLFGLMQTKSLSDITITELVRGAGVARASFYRNYDSKEDVLVTLVRDVLELYRNEMHEGPEGVYSYDNVLLSFQFFERHRDYMLDICRSGFALTVLEELNHFHESLEGSMLYSSTERYTLYMYIGALFNTAVTWLSDENRADASEIASLFYETVRKTRGC